LWSDNTLKINRMSSITRKHVRKKKCIVKKKNIHCKKKKECKKVTSIRKKMKRRVAYPRPELSVIASQGPQGLQGLQGPQGPPGPIMIPQASILLTAKRYFYIASSDITLPSDLPANQFTNDDGESIAEFTDFEQNSYANLFINGIMQVGSSYRVSTSALAITDDHGINETIYAGTPIILETVRCSVQILP
jgi:hypothetical protein